MRADAAFHSLCALLCCCCCYRFTCASYPFYLVRPPRLLLEFPLFLFLSLSLVFFLSFFSVLFAPFICMNMIPYLFLICLIPTCFGARPTSIRLGQGISSLQQLLHERRRSADRQLIITLLYQGCTLLKNTIYCYGGGKYASGSTAGAIDSDDHFTTFAEHYALDLTSGVDQVSADAWRNISTPPNGFVLEPNADFALIPVPQSNSYIVHGGLGYNNGNTALRNRTVMFHADTETWETIATPPTVELM